MTTHANHDHDTAMHDLASTTTNHREGATGHLVNIDGTTYYAVEGVDRMPPFLMSIVSDGDRWMFLSSSGGLTAGRRDATRALFPYETDDRLHLLSGVSGSATAIRLDDGRPDEVWRPMIGIATGSRRRALYKSVVGDSVVFDEEDEATGLRFRYRWATGDRFGFIRTTTLRNEGDRRRVVHIVDGVRNILPHGLDPSMYLPMGNLTLWTEDLLRRAVVDGDDAFQFDAQVPLHLGPPIVGRRDHPGHAAAKTAPLDLPQVSGQEMVDKVVRSGGKLAERQRERFEAVHRADDWQRGPEQDPRHPAHAGAGIPEHVTLSRDWICRPENDELGSELGELRRERFPVDRCAEALPRANQNCDSHGSSAFAGRHRTFRKRPVASGSIRSIFRGPSSVIRKKL